MANRLALLSIWAIGRMLNGYGSGHEGVSDSTDQSFAVERDGPNVKEALNRMLTPYLTRKLGELGQFDLDGSSFSPFFHNFPAQSARGKFLRYLAKLLTTNSTNPYLIWDNQCRAELETLLDMQVVRLIKTVSTNHHHFIIV